jgi:DNA polymerase-1
MRKNAKIASTYFANLVETARLYDGGYYVHANIRTLGARTSRMSISDPPLQQLPKSSPLVRRAFIPRHGRKIISTDYSQIEMREMAHFSEDAGLVEAFRHADATGGDFFVEMGKQIYSQPDFQKKDKRRGLVKNTMYGSAYGAGVAKMAESAGVLVTEMEPVVRQIAATFPGLKRFQKDIERLARSRENNEGQGYVITPFGRRLPCDEGKAYTLVNYLLQGHAAEIFKKSLVELDAAGFGEWMLLPVHDEIVMDMPDDLVKDALVEVPRIMENTTDYRVPIYAEAEGPFDDWGAKYL